MATNDCNTPCASNSEAHITPFEALQNLGRGVNKAVQINDEVTSLLDAAMGHEGNPADILSALKTARERHGQVVKKLAQLDMDSINVEDDIEAVLLPDKTPVVDLTDADKALITSEIKAVLEAAEESGGNTMNTLVNAGTRLTSLLSASYSHAEKSAIVHSKADIPASDACCGQRGSQLPPPVYATVSQDAVDSVSQQILILADGILRTISEVSGEYLQTKHNSLSL